MLKELETLVIPEKARIVVKYPDWDRASFSIHIGIDGKFSKLDIFEVYDLDSKYKSGEISLPKAKEEMDRIRSRIYEIRDRFKSRSSEVNKAIVESYYSQKYRSSKKKRMRRPSVVNAYSDLMRSIRIVGENDLTVANIDDIQDAIDEGFPSYHTHCSAVGRLNSLLEYVGRKERVIRLNKPKVDVPYHTEEEFFKTLSYISEDHQKAAFATAFSTGAREGEVFALSESRTYVRKRRSQLELRIHEQMYREKEGGGWYGPTKNRKERKALVFASGKDYLKHWFRIPEAEKIKLRKKSKKSSLNQIWKRACRAAGTNPIRFHDLRHSYAIKLLELGLAPSMVAR